MVVFMEVVLPTPPVFRQRILRIILFPARLPVRLPLHVLVVVRLTPFNISEVDVSYNNSLLPMVRIRTVYTFPQVLPYFTSQDFRLQRLREIGLLNFLYSYPPPLHRRQRMQVHY